MQQVKEQVTKPWEDEIVQPVARFTLDLDQTDCRDLLMSPTTTPKHEGDLERKPASPKRQPIVEVDRIAQTPSPEARPEINVYSPTPSPDIREVKILKQDPVEDDAYDMVGDIE